MLRLMTLKAYVEAKLGQRGAAIVEYAMLLAFVAIVAAAFLGEGDGIVGKIANIVSNINGLLEQGAAESKQPTNP